MTAISNAIKSVWSFISQLYYVIRDWFNIVWDVFSSIWSILSTLWYWAITLFSNLLSLIKQVFEWYVFENLPNWFNQLSQFIGGPATVFVMTLLFIVIVRIWIAFVFKIFRLNIDYKDK